MSDTGSDGEAPKRRGRQGGSRKEAAAANGSRMGRPPSPARARIAEAKRLTREKQDEAVAQAIAEAEAVGRDVTVASAAATLEAEIAVNARRIARKLMEAADGVLVQETGKDGQPRVYNQPPSVPALIYLSNRIAGTPISKAELLDLADRMLARKEDGGGAGTIREDILAELAAMVLELYRDARSARPAALAQLEQKDAEEAADGE